MESLCPLHVIQHKIAFKAVAQPVRTTDAPSGSRNATGRRRLREVALAASDPSHQQQQDPDQPQAHRGRRHMHEAAEPNHHQQQEVSQPQAQQEGLQEAAARHAWECRLATDMAAREAAVGEREAALARREAALVPRLAVIAEIAGREATVSGCEAAATARAAALAARAALLDERERALEQKALELEVRARELDRRDEAASALFDMRR